MPPVRPHGPKFSQFHAVFWKIWQNRMLVPPGLAPPPTENPGSVPAKFPKYCLKLKEFGARGGGHVPRAPLDLPLHCDMKM